MEDKSELCIDKAGLGLDKTGLGEDKTGPETDKAGQPHDSTPKKPVGDPSAFQSAPPPWGTGGGIHLRGQFCSEAVPAV